MGNHKTKCRNRLRSCGVREWMFLQLVCFFKYLQPCELTVRVKEQIWNHLFFFFFTFAQFNNIKLILGIKSADRNELAQVSSKPSSDFTSFVGDFKLLNTLLPLVSPRVCSAAGGVYASDGMYGCHSSTSLYWNITYSYYFSTFYCITTIEHNVFNKI